MPGVLIIEALAQVSVILVYQTLRRRPDDKSLIFFAGIDNARFKRQVFPGDQLVLEATELRLVRGVGKFAVRASVGDALVAEARAARRAARHLTRARRSPHGHRRRRREPWRRRRDRALFGGRRGRERRGGHDDRRARRHRRANHASAATTACFQFSSIGDIPQDRKYDGDADAHGHRRRATSSASSCPSTPARRRIAA